MLAALQNPLIYPENPQRVTLIQTHISAVFLTGEHAYKIKKPVNFGFLDFTTLEKRKYYCRREIVLNRRLSPEIYLGLVEIRLSGSQISLGEGAGEVVEYAVLMKQLPLDCTMDRRLARGEITPETVDRLATKIADFHSRAENGPAIGRYGEIEIVRGNVEENFAQTEEYVGPVLPPEMFHSIREENRRFMDNQIPLFLTRVREGKIRDCHGDLHLRHVCLNEEILIFDCIEFNDRFRFSDVASDFAFLVMDLDYHREPFVSADLASRYLRISKDWSLFRLLDFYKSYRAYVRGKVACFGLNDPAISGAEKDQGSQDALRYFALARHYASRLNRPALLVVSGLMGTGKSTLARSLSAALGWKWLRSDVVRKELAEISPLEHRFEEFGRGIYSPDFSQRTYETLLGRASELLGSGQSAVIDASFSKQAVREQALAAARQGGAEFFLVECQCSGEEIQRRLARRPAQENEPSDGRWGIFFDQKREYEKIVRGPFLALNTEGPPEEGLARVFRHLLARGAEELTEKLYPDKPGTEPGYCLGPEMACFGNF